MNLCVSVMCCWCPVHSGLTLSFERRRLHYWFQLVYIIWFTFFSSLNRKEMLPKKAWPVKSLTSSWRSEQRLQTLCRLPPELTLLTPLTPLTPLVPPGAPPRRLSRRRMPSLPCRLFSENRGRSPGASKGPRPRWFLPNSPSLQSRFLADWQRCSKWSPPARHSLAKVLL